MWRSLTGFFEERALLLGKLGRHEQALALYVHVIGDNKAAQMLVLIYTSLHTSEFAVLIMAGKRSKIQYILHKQSEFVI